MIEKRRRVGRWYESGSAAAGGPPPLAPKPPSKRRRRWPSEISSGWAAGGSSSNGGGGSSSRPFALLAGGLGLLSAACLLSSAASAGASMPTAVSEALRPGTLGHHHHHHHHQPRDDAVVPPSRDRYRFDLGGGSGDDGGLGAAGLRALAVSDKGTVGSGGGGSKGKATDKKASKSKTKTKVKEKEDTTPKALEALVVGGNFTLNGKSTNVAQYDPVRWAARKSGTVHVGLRLVASPVCFSRQTPDQVGL